MRFAVDLAPRIGIKDLPSYLAGSVYPDSRYVTGIQRNLTHGQDVPNDPFDQKLDDFGKGWAAHVLYDDKALQRYKDLSPWPEHKIVGFGQEWIFATAEKFVEDLISFDIGKVPAESLKQLATPSPINQEDPSLLNAYYDDIKKLYSKRPNLDDYRRLVLGWNIDERVVDQLMDKIENMLADKELVEKISQIYTEVVQSIS